MANFVRTKLVNNFIDRIRDSDSKRVRDAIQGDNSSESRKAVSNLLGVPDFIIEGTTDSNTAALSAGAAASIQVNLSTEGVSFPSGYVRRIDILSETRDGSARNFQHIRQYVLGGTNPTLIRGVQNVGPRVGGICTFANSGTDIAVSEALGGFSVTTDETATGRFAAAIPPARRVIVESLHMAVVGTASLAAAVAHAHLNAINLSTGVIELGTRLGDAATNLAPADTMQLHIKLDHLPVANPELAIVTTTDPDQVVVGAVGESSDVITWHTEVFISDPYNSSLV